MKTLIITGGKINKNFAKKYLKSNKYDIIIIGNFDVKLGEIK